MYNREQLAEIHRIAHTFAQLKGHEDPRIREVAGRCRTVERLCESIQKGARNSALEKAFSTLDRFMIEAVIIYTMDKVQDAPPGWGPDPRRATDKAPFAEYMRQARNRRR